MMTPTDRVTVGAATLTARVWALLCDAYTAAGVDPGRVVVTQGSWHHGSQSGSTHDGGGAFDLRTWNLPPGHVEPVVRELRARNVCAWYRDQAHGGFDPHIHGIVRDEAGLSSGARWQVTEYDHGHDGLASAGPEQSAGPDYHARPPQHPYIMGDTMALTAKEITDIADAVWARALPSAWDGKVKSAGTLLTQAHYFAIEGGVIQDSPPTATTAPGTPTVAKQLRDAISATPAPPGSTLTDADVARIAQAVADVLAARAVS